MSIDMGSHNALTMLLDILDNEALVKTLLVLMNGDSDKIPDFWDMLETKLRMAIWDGLGHKHRLKLIFGHE